MGQERQGQEQFTLTDLRDELRVRPPSGDSGRHSLRDTARHLGRLAACDLDRAWQQSQTAASGPIEVIDFFSGCGGMSAGFKAANGLIPAFHLLGAIDIDPVANRTYRDNFEIEPLAQDVSRLARRPGLLHKALQDWGRQPRNPLVMIGCAPCQGFSSHRNSAGRSDHRNSLFLDFARIAARVRPAAVVVENVPELLTSGYWSYVEKARRTLERAGYFVHVTCHNMAAFGVPQERFRVLMLAMRKPFHGPEGFLSRHQFRTVWDAIGPLPAVSAGATHPGDSLHRSAGHKDSTIAVIRAVKHDGGNRPPGVGPLSLTRMEERQGKPGYEDVYGRLAWDKPAITITAFARNPASGRFVHPEQDRGLTIREAALLQGFPASYAFAGSLDDCFRQIGNAVPPPFAAYLSLHVLGELLASRLSKFDQGIREPVATSFSRIIPSLKAAHA